MSRLDDAHAARRKYKKDLDHIKPDLASYNKQKELALGLAPGTLSKAGQSSSTTLTQFDPSGGQAVSSVQQQLAAESLYRDANTLLYADNKPTEDAIDKVVEKMNKEYVIYSLFSRRLLTLWLVVLTRRRNSRGRDRTRMKVTSPTSTNVIVSSTRR